MWMAARTPGSGELRTTFTEDVLTRLETLGRVVPTALPAPAGAYEPYRLHRGLGFLAAQVPGYDSTLLGRIGREIAPERGREAAALAALNAIARIHEALSGLDRLERLLHVAGHVACDDGFRDAPGVLDGASELFVAALGEKGRHSRTAYAPTRLPRDVCIELEITFAYRE